MSSKLLSTLPLISSMDGRSIGDVSRGLGLGTPVSTAWGTANLAVYIPFYCQTSWKFTTFTWRNGATISGNLDAGVFSWDGRKIVTLGTTAQAAGANTIQTGTVASTSLGADRYWLGMSFSSATATVFGLSYVNIHVAMAAGMFNQATALPLPTTTFTLANPTSVVVPVLAIS